MALTYRDKRTGKVSTLLEPAEIEAAGEREAERLSRPGTKKAKRAAERAAEIGRKRAVHVRHTLQKMDLSERWERLSDKAEIEAAEKAWRELRRTRPGSKGGRPAQKRAAKPSGDADTAAKVSG